VLVVSTCVLSAFAFKSSNLRPVHPLSIEVFPATLSESLKNEIQLRLTRLDKNPTAGSWGSLGELCVAHGLLPQAEICFQNASTLAPDNPKWAYHRALIKEKVDLAAAIELYEKVLTIDQSVSAVYYHHGRALARVGRFDEAERSLKTALEMTHNHPLVLKAMSQLRMMQGDGKSSLELMLKALHDDRAGLDILEEAKRLWMRQSPEIEMDSSLLTDSNNSRPSLTEPLPEPWIDEMGGRAISSKTVGIRASALESQKQFKAAREMYERLMRMQEQNSRAHTAHAMVLYKAGNASQALEEMNRVCKEFPKDALVFSSRGTIEAQLEDIPSAIKSFEESVRIKPDFVDAHRALLLLYQIQKLNDKIDQQFRVLLSLVPTDTELRRHYADFQKSRDGLGQ
jgi:tetratricopeptide (TPR) repeat protein